MENWRFFLFFLNVRIHPNFQKTFPHFPRLLAFCSAVAQTFCIVLLVIREEKKIVKPASR